ncbi:holo-ACP synthase [Anaeromyxobacter oryzisoli]|uniref:holo-ACP synthase n=1 Tax=Anaeromyxobacter oryzisoli TaxID=2925408 RepID=UPI0024133526|nr:holo-ACP synthase [Anaeromyxobacter sp. SG63]
MPATTLLTGALPARPPTASDSWGPTGIGADVVDVARIERSVRRAGFVSEVFSDEERRYCEAQARPSQHYAARFAAKEAFLKALGLGILSGVELREIEVVRDADGRPGLQLGTSAASALRRARGGHPLLSLSHDGPCALAFVVVP